jgi:hypothetical protein
MNCSQDQLRILYLLEEYTQLRFRPIRVRLISLYGQYLTGQDVKTHLTALQQAGYITTAKCFVGDPFYIMTELGQRQLPLQS